MADELLRLTGIHKSFAGVRALRGVDLTVEQGKIHCLVGENGCGKSTLIKIIAGVYPRDEGSVVINGTSYERLHPIDAIREGIQVIYQDFSLFPNLTVAENIALNEELAGGKRLVNWRQVRRIARGCAGPDRGGYPAGRARGRGLGRQQAAHRHLQGAAPERPAHHHGRADQRVDRTGDPRTLRRHPQAAGRASPSSL
ncbi:MAG: ATP-binding cassette domain-containing protein [Caldilineaceae bacterium]